MKPDIHIYNSSAGSGKTFTLVAEYLKLVLSERYPLDSVMAITFTNKATTEMKQRLMSALYSFSNGKFNAMSADISQSLQIGEEELKKRSQKILHSILHSYSQLKISTIDSFYYSILRSLARELHVSLRFELELDNEEAINYILNFVFEDSKKNKKLERWIRDFILSELNEEKSWNIDEKITTFSEQLFSDSIRAEGLHKMISIDDEFLDSIYAVKNSISNELEKRKTHLQNLLKQHGIHHTQLLRSTRAYVYKLLTVPFSKEDDFKRIVDPNSGLKKFYDSAENWFRKNDKGNDELKKTIQQYIWPVYCDLFTYYCNNYKSYNDCVELLSKVYLAGLLYQLDEGLKKFRNEKEKILISDIQLLLQQYMEPSSTGLVYEKLGAKLRVLLIDEFQDTSTLQWKNILPLAEDMLSQGGRLMLVGDLKQSIYRFRGGNMELMNHIVQDDLSLYQSYFRHSNLNGNFRSLPQIVNFNNQLFTDIGIQLEDQSETLVSAYSESQVQQEARRNDSDHDGYVHVEVVQKNKLKLLNTSFDEYTSNRMAQKIIDLIAKGYKYKDMAILVRNKKESVTIVDELAEYNIHQIISNDSLMLSNATHIQFLIHCLMFLNQPDDQITLFSIYRFIMDTGDQNISQAIKQLSIPVSNNQLLNQLPAELVKILSGKNKDSVYEIVLKISSIMDFNKKPDLYLDRFMDLIHTYRLQSGSNISSFLEWWEQHVNTEKCKIKTSENTDAIRISTIHKSKGLQYKIVFIPFAHSILPSKPPNGIIWADLLQSSIQQPETFPVAFTKKLEYTSFASAYTHEKKQRALDQINTLYVALTRAEDMMYICHYDDSKEENQNIEKVSGLLVNKLKTKFSQIRKEDEDLSEIWSTGSELNYISVNKSIQNDPMQDMVYTTLALQKNQNWSKKIFIRPGRKVAELKNWKQQPDATLSGIYLHQLMSKAIQINNIEEAIRQFINKSIWTEEQLTTILESSRKAFHLLSQNNWISGNDGTLYTEQEIALGDGEIIRPDLIIKRKTDTLLIDYKYAQKDESHTTQLIQYKESLKQSGFGFIRAFLLYLPSCELIELKG